MRHQTETCGRAKKSRIRRFNESLILDAALEVFAHYGFHGTSIGKIAAAVEMSKPNVHYYFRSKEDLHVALLMRTIEDWLAPLSHLDPDGDPIQELGNYIAAKVEIARCRPAESRLLASEIAQGAPFIRNHLQAQWRDLVERRARVIEIWVRQSKIRRVDPCHLIFLIWTAIQHYADFVPRMKAVTNVSRPTKACHAEIAAALGDLILRGIVPRVEEMRGDSGMQLPAEPATRSMPLRSRKVGDPLEELPREKAGLRHSSPGPVRSRLAGRRFSLPYA